MNLKRNKDEYMIGFQGVKGREKLCNYYKYYNINESLK